MNFWQHPLIARIGPDQVKSLIKATPSTIIGKLVATTIVALALWGEVPQTELMLWWAFSMSGMAYVLWRWHKNKNVKVTKVSRRAINRLMLSAGILALPWTYATFRFFGDLPNQTELILVTGIAGLTAAGSAMVSRVFPAAMVYLTLAMGPIIIKCFWIGKPEYFLLGLMAIGFVWFQRNIIHQGARMSLDNSQAFETLAKKVAEMDKTKADLQRFAMEDPLTKLPNRREFHTRLNSAINEARRQDSSVTLLICDLDHFKNINDISGHEAGDHMLVTVAERLQNAVRDHDFVARIGGDEFAIIAKHHKSPKNTADFTTRLLNLVNRPVEISGSSVRPGMSIGISMFPYDAQNAETIMSHADLALQRGKAAGRGNFYFFDQQMKSKFSSDEALESDLRLALVDDELEMYYQPKVSIRTGKLQGFEALLRWRKPDGSVVAPGEFFSVAEDRGLISFISDFVIRRTLQDIANWKEDGLDPGKVSINIHPAQIKDEHRMKRIVRDIERSDIDPSKIYLEITEGCVVGRGTEDVPKLLEYLRNKGLRISLDDFGTGFASLSHLKDLPVDELKFDRSFISGLLSDAPTRAIVHAMVKLAKSLNIETVAEGIETKEQHNVLMAIGCSTGQGYLYNKPLDLEASTKLLEHSQSDLESVESKITTLVSPALDKKSCAAKTELPAIRHAQKR